MNALTWVHIAGGSIALLAGALAVAARKGGRIHAGAGTWFAVSMLVLGISATILGRLKEEPDSGLGGLLTCYFVLTSWVTARRREGTTGKFEIFACAAALGMAALMIWGGLTGATTPAGPGPVFAIAAACGLAGLGDLKAVLRRALTPAQRLSRHLWRMCFAFFIATGSFFLGQQDVMPEGVRGSPVLFVLAFAPFAVMLFWLVRLRFAKMVGKGDPASAQGRGGDGGGDTREGVGMTQSPAILSPRARLGRDSEVPLWRLWLLRANYLVWAAAGLFIALPPLIDPDPMARGMVDSMFGGLWVMGIAGLRYPLLMLPIFLFEFVWKTIWLLAFGLPQWLAGTGSPRLSDDLVAIGNGPVLFGLIIPWSYVWRHYFMAPAERWR